jgi:energy-converting hydrogenase A subunit R
MRNEKRIFVTDCEGPISKNDNAFELASFFIPNGDRFFTLISKYDDVQADIIRRQGYKAGDTLKLILPFLRAYGATNNSMKAYSFNNLILVPGAPETLRYVRKLMPSFIVSTSYEHYISALCEAVGFPMENVYCTRLDIDKYVLADEEKERLRSLAREILKMPFIEIPNKARSLSDLSLESQLTIKRLDEIFWDEISKMVAGKMLHEVNPVGGYEKAKAVKETTERVGISLSEVLYVGDSITDVDAFKIVRKGDGLTVSFNGNQYAVREAEIAVMSYNTIPISIIAEIFKNFGKDYTIHLLENWSIQTLDGVCSSILLNKLKALYPERAPIVKRITHDNMEWLIRESSSFRKSVRGEAIGRLG